MTIATMILAALVSIVAACVAGLALGVVDKLERRVNEAEARLWALEAQRHVVRQPWPVVRSGTQPKWKTDG